MQAQNAAVDTVEAEEKTKRKPRDVGDPWRLAAWFVKTVYPGVDFDPQVHGLYLNAAAHFVGSKAVARVPIEQCKEAIRLFIQEEKKIPTTLYCMNWLTKAGDSYLTKAGKPPEIPPLYDVTALLQFWQEHGHTITDPQKRRDILTALGKDPEESEAANGSPTEAGQ